MRTGVVVGAKPVRTAGSDLLRRGEDTVASLDADQGDDLARPRLNGKIILPFYRKELLVHGV